MANAMCILCPLSTLVYPMYLFLFLVVMDSRQLCYSQKRCNLPIQCVDDHTFLIYPSSEVGEIYIRSWLEPCLVVCIFSSLHSPFTAVVLRGNKLGPVSCTMKVSATCKDTIGIGSFIHTEILYRKGSQGDRVYTVRSRHKISKKILRAEYQQSVTLPLS